jgi:tetratricopeptide (TPR) repeat protein
MPLPAPTRARPAREVVKPAEPTPEVPPLPPESAASVFELANRARVSGERARAIAGYRHLLAVWPSADEATLTHATLGRLLLDSGDPGSALVEFEAYLASGEATLREETMAARAVAYMRLGRVADELAAWRALLGEFPDTIHAVRAQSRTGVLSEP